MISATSKAKAAAFEWLREQALGGGGNRHAAIMLQEIHRGAECADDDSAQSVCEGMYIEKCDDVNGLCAALLAVYAISGEDQQVKKIVEDAIEEHGGPNAP